MSIDLFVIIILILSLVVGIFLGIVGFKVYISKQNKKLLENAEQVLNGKRDNKIKIDGQEYDANKFVVRDKDDNIDIIDLREGGTVQHGRGQEEGTRTEEVQEQEVETPREVSSGSREKKRTPRVRSILSRIRRFG